MLRASAFLVLSLSLWIGSPSMAIQLAPPAPPPAAEALDALQKFNLTFKANYAWQRKREIASVPTMVWAIGDNLVLYRKNERTEATVIPKNYHVLKAFAHVPLTAQITLESDTDKELAGETLEKTKALLTEITGLKATVETYGLKKPSADRQHAMIDATIAFLNKTIEATRVSRADLTAFSRRQRTPVMANIAEAARLQIDSMHAQMKTWRALMTPAEWKEMKVAVSGPSMPRIGNLTVQYFAKLLQEKGEGQRIIYTEWAWDENTMSERIGTDLLDTRVAVSFFGENRRMHRDLLSDAATAILKSYPMSFL